MDVKDVKKAKKGNKKAFETIIMENIDDLYRVAYGFFTEEEDRADAVSSAVLKAYEKISTLEKEEFFKTWITRILINECNQIIRNKKKVVFIEEYEERANIREEDNFKIEIKSILNTMEADLKVIVVMYYFEDMNILEISEILEIPEGTVKSRLYRARQVLQKELNYEDKKLEGGM